ncbi:ATP-dependent zinc metalloprotease FtsH [Aurantibacillus circumpalustris]|uniref:ATP-dependent zinc metalloprotease FtsH n=1 Tax=Aurantibacillus circumpalustris TaxID=3036359 RepID=UPI00295B18A7|nr:ATP-dependent zinc metalloprotease FtsH [Aurantibacillus circumpalustris]
MSEEQKQEPTQNTNSNQPSSPEEERKKQFERMKEKFGRQNSPFGGGGNKGGNGGNNFYWIYGVVVVVLLMVVFYGNDFNSHLKEVPQSKFYHDMLLKGDVQEVVIVNKSIARITVNPDSVATANRYKDPKTGLAMFDKKFKGPQFFVTIPSIDYFLSSMEKVQTEAGIPKDRQISARSIEESNWMTDNLSFIIPILLMIVIWVVMMRRMGGGGSGGPGQIFNIGKSKATLFDKDTHVNITFNDVAGLDGAKMEVMEIVDFLKNPKKYTDLGAKIPKGALLVGPPGTGKTLLAKAVAGEAKVPFFSLSGSDFVEMFVGVGASRVRDLFRQAKEKAPCIIFIDEIDAIGRARGKSASAGANDERENTLNQLLTEMDGFGTNSGVIILAATNRADILDRALMRAGRFDRQIYVDMPDLNERKEIFAVHLKKIKIDESVHIDFLAKQTPGFSGADIANICNEAALIAARSNKKVVQKQDFLDAVDRIIAGLEKKNKIITVQEKRVIAFHEAGHATVSWMLEHASPLVKVTIVPRGRSLGAAWYLPEERQITTLDQILDEMCAALGGRAAEEIVFGKVSTGALSDLEKITKQAYACIVYYGLNEKIGNISYYDSSGQSEYAFSKPYSENTARTIDEEVKKMTDIAYAKTKQILMSNKDKLTMLAEKLLEKEVIFKEDLEEIFGKRPFDKHEELPPTKVEIPPAPKLDNPQINL